MQLPRAPEDLGPQPRMKYGTRLRTNLDGRYVEARFLFVTPTGYCENMMVRRFHPEVALLDWKLNRDLQAGHPLSELLTEH